MRGRPSSVAELDQVSRRKLSAGDVVHGDARERGVDRAASKTTLRAREART
jgi:hypothetical protein